MARKPRHPRDMGISPLKAGLVALLTIALFTYFGFSKANPFRNPFKLNAAFETVNNLRPNSPVRIAGVTVGKVTKVEPIDGSGGAHVEMDIEDNGLPIHEDAEIKIRPRIFLEGNFFVDLEPGTPSTATLDSDDDPIPSTQTAAPVQFGDVLAALESDTRADLQIFLQEYSRALVSGGADGFNESIKYWEDAYRSGSLANQATLGTQPSRDLRRVLVGQQGVSAALSRHQQALKDLVTNFNSTAGALASEDVALEASVPALRDTLEVALPTLASLNDALPSLRRFAVEALPGVRSSGPTLRASLPFIAQARALVTPAELGGTASVLRASTPKLTRLNRVSVPLLEQSRALSACTNEVLVPFITTDFPDPDFPQNTGTVNHKIQRSFVGLAGESRGSDGNQSFFHGSATAPPLNVRPAPPPDGGNQPPARRPDIPCETQEKPNLDAPSGPIAAMTVSPPGFTAKQANGYRPREVDPAVARKALREAASLMRAFDLKLSARRQRALSKELDRLGVRP